MDIEELAINKHPKETSKPCPKSAFADGRTHRVGMVPVLSLLDGGVSGDVFQEMCLECGRMFARRCFVVKAQPCKLGTA